MTNRELETRYNQMKATWKNLINANVKLVDENKMLKEDIERLNNIINELEEYIKPYLYMLNGIQDRDIYEQCQLDDFTDIMGKLQELKENK